MLRANHFQAWHFGAYHFNATGAQPEGGGWLSPEQARKALRKVQRARERREERRRELEEAYYEAEQLEAEGAAPAVAVEPVKQVIESDLDMPILLDTGSLDVMLAQLAEIDQQWRALNQRRADDLAAAVLLLD